MAEESIKHSYRFTVEVDGVSVGSFRSVSGISMETESVEWRTGDSNFTKSLPGISKQTEITLTRAMDNTSYFQSWYSLVWSRSGEPSKNYRKDVLIKVADRDGSVYKTIKVYDAWPSRSALGDLDASNSEPWTEEVVLQHNGWEFV